MKYVPQEPNVTKVSCIQAHRVFCLSLCVWGTRSSMLDWVLDAGLSCTKGVWYIYDWDTG